MGRLQQEEAKTLGYQGKKQKKKIHVEIIWNFATIINNVVLPSQVGPEDEDNVFKQKPY